MEVPATAGRSAASSSGVQAIQRLVSDLLRICVFVGAADALAPVDLN